MRHQSARLRMVDKLLGGAHLLLPVSETTIAVRAYYPKDLGDDQPQGDHGLVAFRDAFKYPIVFFVLPVGPVQQKALSDMNSFVNRAQIIMNNWDGTSSQQKASIASNESDCTCIVVLMYSFSRHVTGRIRSCLYRS